MKKSLKIIISIVFVLVSILICGQVCYAYVSDTYISKKRYDDEHKIVFIDDSGKENTKTFKDLGIEAGKKYIKRNDPELIIDYEKLSNGIKQLNTDRSERIYPKLFLDENVIEVSNYDDGTLLDENKLYDYILHNSSTFTLDVKLNDFLIQYDEIAPSELYEQLYEKAAVYNNFLIEYTNEETIKLEDLINYIEIKDNEILNNFESDDFYRYLKEILKIKTDSYNTYYGNWDFVTTSGKEIIISKNDAVNGQGVYGSIVDNEQELEYVYNLICNLESQKDRIPILSVDNGFEIPNTYIEVDIENQHVWLYKDGQLVMDSGCVTGNKNSMDTPTGVYYVFQKAHNVHFPTGGSSKNWMKFTYRGHGLHDATWRSLKQFDNANTYKGNGSHGCVNLPLDFSTKLYNEIEEGIVVVIY